MLLLQISLEVGDHDSANSNQHQQPQPQSQHPVCWLFQQSSSRFLLTCSFFNYPWKIESFLIMVAPPTINNQQSTINSILMVDFSAMPLRQQQQMWFSCLDHRDHNDVYSLGLGRRRPPAPEGRSSSTEELTHSWSSQQQNRSLSASSSASVTTTVYMASALFFLFSSYNSQSEIVKVEAVTTGSIDPSNSPSSSSAFFQLHLPSRQLDSHSDSFLLSLLQLFVSDLHSRLSSLHILCLCCFCIWLRHAVCLVLRISPFIQLFILSIEGPI